MAPNGMEFERAFMDRARRRPQALHMSRLPQRRHVGVLVVPHSVQICRTQQELSAKQW